MGRQGERQISKEEKAPWGLKSCVHILRKFWPLDGLVLADFNRIFWQNCTGGLLNQKDFFDTIAKHVRIHTGDIDKLEKGMLRLKNGENVPTDAILCGTGWMPSLQFSSSLQTSFGNSIYHTFR